MKIIDSRDEKDDFDFEVDALRNSSQFQSFLDQRMQSLTRICIDDIEKEVGQRLSGK